MLRRAAPALLLVTLACSTSPKPAVLKLDARDQLGGGAAQARIEVPAGWAKESVRGGGLASFLGPDNFSRIQLRARAVTAAPESCSALADDAVTSAVEAIGKGAAVLERRAAEGEVSFQVRDARENLPERLVFGRAVCRGGALAVVTCTFGSARQATLGPSCERVVASLTIDAAQAPAKPAPPEKPEAAPVPAQQAAPEASRAQ